MASRRLNDLQPAVHARAKQFNVLCRQAGFEPLIYCTKRSMREQAALWRNGRSRATIDAQLGTWRDPHYRRAGSSPSAVAWARAMFVWLADGASHGISTTCGEDKPEDAQLVTAMYEQMADLVEGAGPQYGRRTLTNALPGRSMHHYGLAFDAVPMVGSKPLWDVHHSEGDMRSEWSEFGKAAKDAGLEWSGDWEGFKEYAHVQVRDAGKVLADGPEAVA